MSQNDEMQNRQKTGHNSDDSIQRHFSKRTVDNCPGTGINLYIYATNQTVLCDI